jgi:alcohol dehydrogenase YqhD (iron-dependent ADH family)
MIGMPTNIHELLGREVTDEEIDHMVQMASRGGTVTLGAIKVLKPEDMRAIYKMAR